MKEMRTGKWCANCRQVTDDERCLNHAEPADKAELYTRLAAADAGAWGMEEAMALVPRWEHWMGGAGKELLERINRRLEARWHEQAEVVDDLRRKKGEHE